MLENPRLKWKPTRSNIYEIRDYTGTPDAALAGEVTERDKVEALKLGYLLNGNSMVRWGSIDLTGPAQTKRMLDPSIPPVVIQTPPKPMDAPK